MSITKIREVFSLPNVHYAVKYNLEEFKKHWVSTQSDGEEKGIAIFLEPTPAFYEKKMDEEPKEERSFNMQVLCKQNIYENCRDKES